MAAALALTLVVGTAVFEKGKADAVSKDTLKNSVTTTSSARSLKINGQNFAIRNKRSLGTISALRTSSHKHHANNGMNMKHGQQLSFMVLMILTFCVAPTAHARGIGVENTTIKKSDKGGPGGTANASTDLKQLESINRQIARDLKEMSSRELTTADQQSMALAKEKFTTLGVQRQRNLTADLLFIAQTELKAALPDALAQIGDNQPKAGVARRTVALLSGFSPSRYGWTAVHIRNGRSITDDIGAKALQIVSSEGADWATSAGFNQTGADNALDTLKYDTIVAMRLGTALAECLEAMQSDPGESREEILDGARLWIRARAVQILTLEYSPEDQAYLGIWSQIKDMGLDDVYFAGALGKYRLGPCLIDTGSNGMLTVVAAGRPMLTGSALGGMPGTISYSDGYSLRQTLGDLKQIGLLRNLTESVQHKIQILRQLGWTKKAATTARIYRDTTYSLSQNADTNSKISLLQATLPK